MSIPVQEGYAVVLTSLNQNDQQIYVTKHGLGDGTYPLKDARTIAHRFMGKGPWQHRRQDLWTIDHIVLKIVPFYRPE